MWHFLNFCGNENSRAVDLLLAFSEDFEPEIDWLIQCSLYLSFSVIRILCRRLPISKASLPSLLSACTSQPLSVSVLPFSTTLSKRNDSSLLFGSWEKQKKLNSGALKKKKKISGVFVYSDSRKVSPKLRQKRSFAIVWFLREAKRKRIFNFGFFIFWIFSVVFLDGRKVSPKLRQRSLCFLHFLSNQTIHCCNFHFFSYFCSKFVFPF